MSTQSVPVYGHFGLNQQSRFLVRFGCKQSFERFEKCEAMLRRGEAAEPISCVGAAVPSSCKLPNPNGDSIIEHAFVATTSPH